jgi:hypothetical protein
MKCDLEWHEYKSLYLPAGGSMLEENIAETNWERDLAGKCQSWTIWLCCFQSLNRINQFGSYIGIFETINEEMGKMVIQ